MYRTPFNAILMTCGSAIRVRNLLMPSVPGTIVFLFEMVETIMEWRSVEELIY